MKASIHLGKIQGISIGLHTSWFLVFGLITFSLGTGYFPNENPDLSVISNLALALITSVLFFGSVLAHELGHSFVALREGISVKGITLFIFGGLAQIEKEPESPGAEFRIAIIGPVVSLGIGLIFGALWFFNPSNPWIAASASYLARINLSLAVFNMIPGFPLDGGRVLRAIIWRLTGDFARSTRIASSAGQVVGYGFIAFGVMSLLMGQVTNGMWLAFIGWFLQNAASGAARQLKVQERLSGVTVAQAMSQECARVPSLTSLQQLVDGWVLSRGQHCFYIDDGYGAHGMLTLQDITKIPQAKWRFITAAQIMTPLDHMLWVEPSMDLLSALKEMEAANLTQAPVIQDKRLVGTLSRERILRYLNLRTRLGM